MKQNIYELLLHEFIIIKPHQVNDPNSYTKVTRVPGGWIYEFHVMGMGEKEVSTSVTATFVPYSDEFNK